MADQSQYLAQALQSMGQQPQAPTYQGPNLQQMQAIAQKKQAWEAANPGQSYMGHGLEQMGQNLMNAPGNLVQGAQNFAALPGQALNGFQKMIQGLPGYGKLGPQQYAGVPDTSNLG